MARIRFSNIQDAIRAVKEAVRIEEVIRDDLGPPKDDRNVNHWWWCPFHGEKAKPSFTANVRLQHFKCFGCQASGDVIGWMQQRHGMSIVEAVLELAQRGNVNLRPFTRDPTDDEKRIDRYQQIMNGVASLCHSLLMNNKPIHDWYLADTGFTDEMISPYQVGYSPSMDTILQFVYSKMQVTEQEARTLELMRGDLFNHALVYPIHDQYGDVARFYCKPLGGNAAGKYISTTTNHPLFTRELLYGLHVAKRHLRDTGGRMIGVEGQKACIASGGATVAFMGTELHAEQAELLRKLKVSTLVACFDADAAGFEASLRLLDQTDSHHGLNVLVAKLPLEGHQVDTLIKNMGRAAYDKVIEEAVPPVQFWMETQYETGNMTMAQQTEALRRLSGYLTKLPELECDIVANYLAGVLGSTAESVRSYVNELRAAQSNLSNEEAERSVLHHAIVAPTNVAALKQALFEPSYFTRADHARLFSAIRDAYNRHGSKMTLQSVIEETQILYPAYDDVRTLARSLVVSEPKHQFMPATKVVQDLWRRRHTAQRAQVLAAQVKDLTAPTVQVVQEFRRSMVNMVDSREGQAQTPHELAAKAMAELRDRMERGSSIIGYDFSQIVGVDGERVGGLPMLNLIFSGAQKEQQTIIAGPQGTGKSLLGLNIAIAIGVTQKVPTLWIAQEMNETETMFRAVSILSGVNNNKVQRAVFDSDEEFLRVQKALEMIHGGQLYMVRPRQGSMDEILAIIDDFRFRYGIKAVIWDYIQLVQPGDSDRGRSRVEILGRASKVMKHQVAGDMQMASICIAQLRRDGMKKGEVGGGEDMGGSYEISQDADNIVTLAEKTPEQMQEKPRAGNRLIAVDKRRGGPSNIVMDANLDEVNATLRYTEAVDPVDAAAITSGLAT